MGILAARQGEGFDKDAMILDGGYSPNRTKHDFGARGAPGDGEKSRKINAIIDHGQLPGRQKKAASDDCFDFRAARYDAITQQGCRPKQTLIPFTQAVEHGGRVQSNDHVGDSCQASRNGSVEVIVKRIMDVKDVKASGFQAAAEVAEAGESRVPGPAKMLEGNACFGQCLFRFGMVTGAGPGEDDHVVATLFQAQHETSGDLLETPEIEVRD
jgi:hypothetical protein